MPNTSNMPKSLNTPAARWCRDLERLLPIRSQFVISGNIRDSVLTDCAGAPALVPLLRGAWDLLRKNGYRCLLVYDPTDGIRVYPNERATRELAERLFDLKLASGAQIMSLETLANIMKNLSTQRAARCALLVDFASRITRQVNGLNENEHRFFVAAEKLSLSAAPIVPSLADAPDETRLEAPGAPQSPPDSGKPAFNPILWLLNRAQDLPSWFTLDSERVANLIVSKPDYETRQAAARLLAPLFGGFSEADAAQRTKFLQVFTDSTDGMTLTALSDICEIAARQNLSLFDIDDAVRCYKVGALDNPWRKDFLREKIRAAAPFIEDRVKGQHAAVVKTLDILKRSAMGLTGAQARSGNSRPRGVLFFAGPTGVGKTELAKTLTQLVFGDERAYIRFDMSEFAEEHSSARLLGAPPGYIGFDAGGELTNAVREKPFSVVLFDEIEKAHPRILDKFLQILEDGRLSDGRGNTAYFSESILVFTSNLGIYIEDAHGQRVPNVTLGDDYATVEANIKTAIEHHFKYKLSRPEILNRIGDNIVVFNFITPPVAELIFTGMLKNIARRLDEEFKLQLVLKDSVRACLLARCVGDLSNGGRGIGNRLEADLINPLARALFAQSLEGCTTVTLDEFSEHDKVVALELTLS